MKVLFDVSYLQPEMTGYGRATREFLRALVEEQEAVDVLPFGWSMALDRSGIHALHPGAQNAFLAPVPGDIRRWYFQHCRWPSLERIVRMPYDLFQGMEPFIPPSRKPSVAVVHDFEVLRFPNSFPRKMHSWGRLVLAGIKRADAVIVPSQFVLSQMTEFAPDAVQKTIVVPWAVSPVFSSRRLPSDHATLQHLGIVQPYLLFVGTIEPRKNLPLLLNALSVMLDRNADCPMLVVVGNKGWDWHDTFRLMEELQRKGKLIYAGGVTDEVLSSLYRLAVATVVPSRCEGFGIPVIEAMACGCPVVSNKGSALEEVGKFIQWLESNDRLFRVDSLRLTPGSVDGEECINMDIIVLGVIS